LNAEIVGIIEMASFTVFESHEIDFIKRASEQITAVIASVKSAHHTAKLLEASQQQQEEVRSQEEEMRQNMEELSATQEEMSRKENEYIRRIRELEALTFTFEKTKT
jgi:predicted transcriptional regulator